MGAESAERRLDSWKAVAAYLDRDIATVRRWEKSLGLPVRRVSGSGRGHSVFAFTDEIDEWLKTSSMLVVPDAASPPLSPVTAGPMPPERAGAPSVGWRSLVAGAALIIAAISAPWGVGTRAMDVRDLRFKTSPGGVTALDRDGRERWHHAFPPSEMSVLLDRDEPLRVASDGDPAVFIATSMAKTGDDTGKGGLLTWLDAVNGRVRRLFSFDDEVRVQGRSYGAPWVITSYSIDSTANSRRIAVAGHHWTWDPGLVTVLDENWNRRGTFVHAGWIEIVRWLGSDRLLVGGYSNPHEGGMVALLDPSKLDGQGPEPPGTPSHCESCGPVAALRMAVMPRTEVNLATKSRFNRAVVELTPDRIIVSTAETEAPDDGIHGAIGAIYEFSRSLDLLSAKFNDQYWAVHRTLEEQDRLDHTREQCPDRNGPRHIRAWEPATGWRTQPTR